jgi:hypothetical protein
MITWRGVRSWRTRRAGRQRDGRVGRRFGWSAAPQLVTPTLQRWVSTLSSPSVEVLILGDHLMICEDGELVAAGSILALPAVFELR